MKKMSLEKRFSIAGMLFLLPWAVGFIFFFLLPFVDSAVYSFNRVEASDNGLKLVFVGWDNFNQMLLVDANFNKSVVDSVLALSRDVPMIIVFAIFVALVLNKKFIGRAMARAVFFLPVIIASGMVVKILKQDILSTGVSDSVYLFTTDALVSSMSQLSIPPEIISAFAIATGQIFDLSWKSGLQIILFLSALQSIPKSYYEAAMVEGANGWECFWKITFPVLSPTIFLSVVYTIIDSFTDMQNPVMEQIMIRINDGKYGFASASAVVYFIVVSIILYGVYRIGNRSIFYNSY